MPQRIVQLLILTIVITTQAEDSVSPYQSVFIDGIPHITQKKDFCGEACAAMYLKSMGESIDQDYIFDRAEVNPLNGRGANALELKKALLSIGFEVGSVWQPLNDKKELNEQFVALHEDLARGIPSIVCMRTSKENDDEHFRLVLGYRAFDDVIVYHDPADANGEYLTMPRGDFLELWALQGKFHWGVIRFRLEPGAIEYGNAATKLTNADYAQRIMALKEKIPENFNVAVEKPFVLVGDIHSVEVADHAQRIVRRVGELVKKDFFIKSPDNIIDIWLFKDENSYVQHTKEIFGHEPITPYGYYLYEENAIIINASTGGGTLVHEIVHTYMAANFKDCPAWFDEGLSTLYERPTTSKQGHIMGLVNWRLEELKQTIREGKLPSFEHLMSQTDEHFYSRDPGSNYGQAKYLCFYLQQQGLLVDFYHSFYESRKQDPTGIESLKKVLNVEDLTAFKAEWERWVLTLPE